MQVRRDDVGGLLHERRIGPDAPTGAGAPARSHVRAAPARSDAWRYRPDAWPAGAVPTCVTGRRRRIQRRDDPPLILGLAMARLATARRIRRPGQAVRGKPATPLADRRRTGCQPGPRLIAQPVGQSQNDLRSKRPAPLGLPRIQLGPQTSPAARSSTPIPPKW